ncbi:MAG: helix-turn-helix transcriptional regulator [Candidatus Eremiobacteraeota bacterium]|nr:helix-turn-helix transcriptional regulator [Candidatus Eremiobacteraeota bacterium]
MINKHSYSPHAPRWNGQRRTAPVESLSARVLRLRIARGYSASDLATEAGVLSGTIRRLESGKPVDKRILSAVAVALGVPYCRLLCGEHSCAERACVPLRSIPEPRRSRADHRNRPRREKGRPRGRPSRFVPTYADTTSCDGGGPGWPATTVCRFVERSKRSKYNRWAFDGLRLGHFSCI